MEKFPLGKMVGRHCFSCSVSGKSPRGKSSRSALDPAGPRWTHDVGGSSVLVFFMDAAVATATGSVSLYIFGELGFLFSCAHSARSLHRACIARRQHNALIRVDRLKIRKIRQRGEVVLRDKLPQDAR
jgi:hypothetical protein